MRHEPGGYVWGAVHPDVAIPGRVLRDSFQFLVHLMNLIVSVFLRHRQHAVYDTLFPLVIEVFVLNRFHQQ